MTDSRVTVGSVTYRITHPASSEALIDEQDFDENERLPYWAEIWPSAIALSRHVARLDLTGKRAIELGCGLGLSSITAITSGADMLATDHYRAALDFSAYNVQTNLGTELKTTHLDWRTPPDELSRFDLVLAADVLYEKSTVPLLAALIPDLLASDGELLLSDPRRDYAEDFLEEMRRRGFEHSAESMIVYRDEKEVKVMLHRLRRGVRARAG